MNKCRNCGASNAPGHLHCLYCSSQLDIDSHDIFILPAALNIKADLKKQLEAFFSELKKSEILCPNIVISGLDHERKKILFNSITQFLNIKVSRSLTTEDYKFEKKGLFSNSQEFKLQAGDLAAQITNLEDGDVMIIDTFDDVVDFFDHDEWQQIFEFSKLNLLIGEGNAAREVKINLAQASYFLVTVNASELKKNFTALNTLFVDDNKNFLSFPKISRKIDPTSSAKHMGPWYFKKAQEYEDAGDNIEAYKYYADAAKNYEKYDEYLFRLALTKVESIKKRIMEH